MTTPARRELTSLRLASQRLTGSTFSEPGDVVRWMLALQAQDFSGAKLSVGLRLPGSTDAVIEAALARGEIVRSWPLRGTLHLVAPEDLGWLLALTRPRVATGTAARRESLGITERELEISADAARALLEGGRVARRDDLLAEFERVGVSTAGQRGYHLLVHHATEGVLVFGPVDGTHQTFTLLDEWVPNPRMLDHDESLAELATRYFRSHGPATEKDLAWWASLPLRDVRRGIDIAALERRRIDGVEYVVDPRLESADIGRSTAEPTLLLPGFDEYLLGYQNRSPVLAAEYASRIVPGNNGVFQPTVIDRGQVVGTWGRTHRADRVDVAISEFTPLPARATAGIRRSLDRYSAFLEKPVVLGSTR